MTRPQPDEAASYYSQYIDLVTSDEIVPAIKEQFGETVRFLEVLNHVNDGERLFLSRAFWFARGFQDAMPSFDQDIAARFANANERSWASLVEEFKTVRASTISFFEHMPDEAWSRSGVASDNPVTVRAIAYIIAGHVTHHVNVLKNKYLSTNYTL
jgi:hypothetical protein